MSASRALSLKWFIVALAALLLASPFACAADHQPTSPIADPLAGDDWAWATQDTLDQLPLTTDNTFPTQDWWLAFNDPALNQWIAIALHDNPELTAIEYRINEARAMANLARSPLFPSLNANASYTRQHYGKYEFLFPIQGDRTFHVYRLPLQASYELDVFGKNIDNYRAGRARHKSAMYTYLDARRTLATTVASAYWNLLLADRQLEEQQTLVKLAKDQLGHSQAQFRQAIVAADAVDASEQLLAAQQAELTRLQANRAIAEQTLSVLAGGNPSLKTPVERGTLADAILPKNLPVGLPSELVTQRPDLAAIEAEMRAAQLDVSVARKAYLPTFRINAQMGLAAIGRANLFRWDSISNILSPTIDWALFTGGARRAQSQAAQARYRQLAENYRGAVLRAFGDVEAALVEMAAHRQLLIELGAEADAVKRIAEHDYQRLTVGLVAQPQWITSELVNREYQKALAQEQAAYLVSYASLMQALGGGIMPKATP